VPTDDVTGLPEEEEMTVYGKAGLANESPWYGVYAYDTDFQQGDLVKAILITQSSGSEKINGNNLFLVTSIGEMVDVDGSVLKAIHGYDFNTDSGKVLYPEQRRNIFDNTKVGDFLLYNMSGNYVKMIITIANSEGEIGSQYVAEGNLSWSGAAMYSYAFGVFTHLSGNYVNFAKQIKYENGEVVRGDRTYDVSASNVMLYRYDTENGTVEKLEADSLAEAVYTNNPDAKVFVRTQYAQLLKAIIID